MLSLGGPQLLRVSSRDALRQIAERLVYHIVRAARKVPCADVLVAAVADQHHLITDRHPGYARDVEQRQVHRDAANHRRALAAHPVDVDRDT